MGDGVLHGAGEGVLRLGVAALCRLDGGLGGLQNAGPLQCRDLHDLAAELPRELRGLEMVAVFPDDVHHVDGHDDRNAKLGELCGEVEISLQIRAVNDVEDGVRALADQIISRHDLLERVRRQRIDAGQVHDDDIIMLFEPALLFFDRDARPVADELVRAGQGVKERRLAAVRVARKGDLDLLFHHSAPSCSGTLTEIRYA